MSQLLTVGQFARYALLMTDSVLFLTGCSGAGKSTTALLWAGTCPRPCALIDHEAVRHFIRSGFGDPGREWNAAAQAQWEIARSICCNMAWRYAQAGIDCVIDTFSPPDDFRNWQAGLHDLAVRIVVLLPPLAVALARNAQRSGDALLRDESIRENYVWMEAWRHVPNAHIIDNGSLAPDETVRQIEQELAPGGS